MNNVITYTATEARKDFFDIFAAVYYGNKTIRVIKNKKMAIKIVRDEVPKKKNIMDFAGWMDNKTYKIMKQVIKKRKLPSRATPIHYD